MGAVLDRGRTTVPGAEVAVRPPRALRPLVAPADPRPRPAPTTAADVMTRFPLTVHQGDSLWTAWGRLADSRDTHIVVVDDHRRPVGVLDDRTLALEWPGGPMAARRAPVHTLLRGRARPRVRSGDDLPAVARVMVGARADAVPVVDHRGRLFGLVTLWHLAELAARSEEDGGSGLDG